MDIRQLIDLDTLQEIQDQFSNATGLAAIAVDAKGEYITKGSNFTDFCMKYTRGSQEGLRRCVKCDTECTGTYFCHAGLMDFSADILVGEEKVGAIIGGQVLPNEPDFESFRQVAKELGIDEERYIEALKKVPVRSEKVIRAAASMLEDVVNRLVNLEYMKRLNQQRVSVLDVELDGTIQAIGEIKSRTQDLQKISGQENILSLNASIEAARAGQAGVGFAVVANQIQKISKDSAKVYSEIQHLVEKIEMSVNKLKESEE